MTDVVIETILQRIAIAFVSPSVWLVAKSLIGPKAALT